MKKTLIYVISLIIGLILGFGLYSLIRTYLPTKEVQNINYDEYREITSNINNLNYIRYGNNINVESNNDFILLNAFLLIDKEDYEIISKNTYNVSLDDIRSNIKKLFGEINYELKDFSYSYLFYEGKCTLDSVKGIYTCVSNDDYDKDITEFNYDILSANYDELGNIIVKSYYYYSKYYCDGLDDNVCLYKDEYANHLVVKCKENEVDDYVTHFDLVTFVYKRNDDNKLYLKEIKW